MKINKIMIVSIVLLAILTLGAVSAADELTANETQDFLESGVDDADIMTHEDVGDELADEEDDYYDYDDEENYATGNETFEIEVSMPDEIVACTSNFINFTTPDDLDDYFEVYLDGESIGGGGFHTNQSSVIIYILRP